MLEYMGTIILLLFITFKTLWSSFKFLVLRDIFDNRFRILYGYFSTT